GWHSIEFFCPSSGTLSLLPAPVRQGRAHTVGSRKWLHEHVFLGGPSMIIGTGTVETTAGYPLIITHFPDGTRPLCMTCAGTSTGPNRRPAKRKKKPGTKRPRTVRMPSGAKTAPNGKTVRSRTGCGPLRASRSSSPSTSQARRGFKPGNTSCASTASQFFVLFQDFSPLASCGCTCSLVIDSSAAVVTG
ncbi:hypothetical protein CCHR01_16600, partial [Colletotrichum chrysophilum]